MGVLGAWLEARRLWRCAPQGEVIERGLIKSVTQMLMDLGPAVYVADFETPYLAAAAEHYKARASRGRARVRDCRSWAATRARATAAWRSPAGDRRRCAPMS